MGLFTEEDLVNRGRSHRSDKFNDFRSTSTFPPNKENYISQYFMVYVIIYFPSVDYSSDDIFMISRQFHFP